MSRHCLDIDVPFGTRHHHMGTHNHPLQLGQHVYLKIVALDLEGTALNRPRWFGLDDSEQVRSDWKEGRRLRGWVANTPDLGSRLPIHEVVFDRGLGLPPDKPSFAFAIPDDGSLPLDGSAPSLIDHRGNPGPMAEIPDMGARLKSFTLEHPDHDEIDTLLRELSVDRPPAITKGPKVRYRAIETLTGLKELA